MQIQTLKVETRKPHGTREAARLRNTGRIPGIIYGHNQTPETIAVDRHQIEGFLSHGAHLANVEMDGRTQACLLKDVQYDHLGSTPIHVDFARIDLNERVVVKVPIELRGHAKGLNEGGAISQQLIDLEVECLPLNIPTSIRVNIAHVGLNDTVHVRDIELPAGVICKLDPDAIVVICREVTEHLEVPTAPVEEGAAAEPEVIAKGKIEKEGEAEAAGAEKAEKKEKK